MLVHIRVKDSMCPSIFEQPEFEKVKKEILGGKDVFINPDHIISASFSDEGYLHLTLTDNKGYVVTSKNNIVDKTCDVLNQLAEKMPDDDAIVQRYWEYRVRYFIEHGMSKDRESVAIAYYQEAMNVDELTAKLAVFRIWN